MGNSSSSSSSSTSTTSCSSNPLDNFVENQIYYPRSSTFNQLNKFRRSDDVVFTVDSDNFEISGFYSPPKSGIEKVLIWSHGNGEIVQDMISYLSHVKKITGMGYIIYDYRGYGCSNGKPTEKGCYQDLTSVISYSKNEFKISQENMILVGRSLGTGITVEYALKNNWKQPIVLISPYKSIIRVMSDTCFASLTSGVDKFKTIDKIGDLECPVKIIHGIRDQMIFVSHGRELYSKLKPENRLVPMWINSADHNNILNYIHPDTFSCLI
jgi:fermentation-respiration switch protein FrsA (DUF1100 family)